MANAAKVLKSLGWIWRENGVELAVNLDGQTWRVFVPITNVCITFGEELAREGYYAPPRVGGYSVAGLWGDVTGAFKSIGKKAGSAISRAASSLTRTASKWASKVPVVNKMPLGMLNMSWASDELARRAFGKQYDRFVPSQIRAPNEMLHQLGNTRLSQTRRPGALVSRVTQGRSPAELGMMAAPYMQGMAPPAAMAAVRRGAAYGRAMQAVPQFSRYGGGFPSFGGGGFGGGFF
jgi:hypothetical protein